MKLTANTLNIHQELIDKCRLHDRVAQYQIYKLYSKAMFNTAVRMLGSREEAEDILQDSFVSAFRNLHSYREDAPFGAWLKRIVVNKSISRIKQRKEMQVLSEEDDAYYFEWYENDGPELNIETVKSAIAELPTGFRTVLTMYLLEGFDHKEIAEVLGISESTSKSQYNRAKKKLRDILGKEVNYG